MVRASRALIDAGANPQARTRKGFSALHFAAREGNLDRHCAVDALLPRLGARGVLGFRRSDSRFRFVITPRP